LDYQYITKVRIWRSLALDLRAARRAQTTQGFFVIYRLYNEGE